MTKGTKERWGEGKGRRKRKQRKEAKRGEGSLRTVEDEEAS